MFDLFELQCALNAAALPLPGEPGSAERIRDWAAPLMDSCEIDHRGNLVCEKKGTGEGGKLMFVAPMETSGFWVTGITEQGYLHLEASPGILPGLLPATPIRFAGGMRGTVRILNSADQMDKVNTKLGMDALFCDIGAADREEAMKTLQIGARGLFDGATRMNAQGAIVTPAAGASAPAIALLLAMEGLQRGKNDLILVFSAGKDHAAEVERKLEPDWVVTLNACPAGDSPAHKPGFSPLKLGGGPALLLNEGPGQHPSAGMIREAAQEAGIGLQEAVASRAWNLAGLLSGRNRSLGGLGVPVRNLHTPGEIYHSDDVRELGRLVTVLSGVEIGG